jgi:hypothetical protein
MSEPLAWAEALVTSVFGAFESAFQASMVCESRTGLLSTELPKQSYGHLIVRSVQKNIGRRARDKFWKIAKWNSGFACRSDLPDDFVDRTYCARSSPQSAARE